MLPFKPLPPSGLLVATFVVFEVRSPTYR